MSSIRVALASCVLFLALGGGTWEAVQAFPLYGEFQAPRDPRPPRDPISADAHHRVAVEYWDTVRRETTLSAAEKRVLILKGIAAEDRALELRPDFVEALTYKSILLRMQALLTDDVQETNDLLKQADALRDRVIALHAATQREIMVFSPKPPPSAPRADGVVVTVSPPPPSPPPPPPSPEYQALLDELKPLRIGGGIKTPLKIRDVRPAYPPIAQNAGVQGVVILEIVVDASGSVAEAQVLRSIPLLDHAALDAVKEWEFSPTLLNGVPTAIVMTVTVNFTLK